MSLAFERYTGVPAATIATTNPVGFVAALNTTFFAAMALSLVALGTSIIGGRREEERRSAVRL
jgi:hypothetical protein